MPIILIINANLEHTYARVNENMFTKKIQFVSALSISYNRDHSTRAHLFLSRHKI